MQIKVVKILISCYNLNEDRADRAIHLFYTARPMIFGGVFSYLLKSFDSAN